MVRLQLDEYTTATDIFICCESFCRCGKYYNLYIFYQIFLDSVYYKISHNIYFITFYARGFYKPLLFTHFYVIQLIIFSSFVEEAVSTF